jgi:hypothetical protein
MTYVMENVSIYQGEVLQETNLVIRENSIYSMYTPVSKIKGFRNCIDHFIMTPTTASLCDLTKLLDDPISYSKEMIKKGSDTLLVPFEISFEYEAEKKYQELVKQLKTIPLDYCIVIVLPLRLLNTNLIRFCKNKKIPAIFVKVEESFELTSIAWGWIKESLFPYNSVLIPLISEVDRQDEILKVWQHVMQEEEISHYSHPIYEEAPIPYHLMKKIGLYPRKGVLRIGGEINYNLYPKEDWNHFIQEGIPTYDKIVCTVIKNKVVRAGNRIDLSICEGQRLTIQVPGFFCSN